MTLATVGLRAVVLLSAASLVGCGGSEGGSGRIAAGTTSASGVKQYAAAQLPPVVLELPPLDEGRIEIPTPDGWQAASRTTGLVARFHEKGRSGIPQMIIKVEDAAGAPESLTAENVVAYAAQVQAELDAQVAAKKTTLLEPVKPMLLGSNPWVRYVVTGKLPNKERATIERQILRSVQRGRIYSIDLQVEANTLTKSRDHAYALAAGVKFQVAVAPPPPETAPAKSAPPGAPPAVTAPTVTPPAEAPPKP